MTKKDTGFDSLMNMWKEGQETLLNMQKEASDAFQSALGGIDGGAKEIGQDAYDAWRTFVMSWAPAWDPDQHNDFGKDLFGQTKAGWLWAMDPATWTKQMPEQLRLILDSISNGPRFADLATPHIDAARSWRETLDYQQAASDLGKVLQDAWGRAFATYSKEYSLDDLQSGDVQKALDAWLSAANAELLETQRSPAFLDAQKRMIRASMEIKTRQRDIAERWCEQYQIPTRSEIDDLTKIVHELRREVRRLKRELAGTSGKPSK